MIETWENTNYTKYKHIIYLAQDMFIQVMSNVSTISFILYNIDER